MKIDWIVDKIKNRIKISEIDFKHLGELFYSQKVSNRDIIIIKKIKLDKNMKHLGRLKTEKFKTKTQKLIDKLEAELCYISELEKEGIINII